MFSKIVFDESLIDIQTDFLLDENKKMATFYRRDSKSFLMCAVLGHENYQIDERDEEGRLTETLTYCIRCRLESIEKFNSNKVVLDTLEILEN